MGYEIFLDVIGGGEGVPNIICFFYRFILNCYPFNSFSDLLSRYGTMHDKFGVGQRHKRQNPDNSPKFVLTEINIFTNKKVLLTYYMSP